jgi:Domain of unknown function (DUF4340)
MNFKTTYTLFAVLLILLGAAAYFLLVGPKQGEEGLLLTGAKGLKAANFDSVTIERTKPTDEKLVFTRVDDKRWKMEKPFETRADASAVDRVIEDLLAARKDGKSEVPKNLAELGLDKPSLMVTLGGKDGTKLTASFGNVTLGGFDAKVFALAGDKPNQPMDIRRGSLSSIIKSDGKEPTAGELCKSAADFRSKELLLGGAGFNPADGVTSFKLTEGKNEIAVAKMQDGNWKFEKPENYGPAEAKGEPGTDPNSTPGGVEALLKSLVDLKPASAEDFVDGAADLTQYGLAKDQVAGPTITVTRKNPAGELRPETLYVGKKDDASGKMFVRLDGETSVAKVPANLLEPVKKVLTNPGTLRDKQLLSFLPLSCDAVDAKLDDKLLELRKTGTPPMWKLFDADGTSQLANGPNLTELLNALNGRIIKDFPETNATDAALGFDRPSAELSLYVGGIIPEEKKEEKKDEAKDKDAKKDESKDKAAKEDEAKDKEGKKDELKDKAKTEEPKKEPAAPAKPKMKEPTARLIFGKRDKDLLFVRRIVKDKDGKETKSDFAVSETLWAKVTRGRLDYLDSVLPSFVTAAATKLDFFRGNEQFTVEKNADKNTWVIRQPADRADRAADSAKIEGILSELAHLAVVRLWAEKPSDREMDRFGLKSPRLKATVTVKDGDKTQEKLYLFGAETDDKVGWYAKQNDRDVVFVVSKVTLPTLENGEIQDPVVWKLDTGKVAGIKLTGWRDVVGQPVTRELERKGASNWALKGDDKIKLSPGQCDAFLNAIGNVRADSFVVHKGGPKPEHKLTVAAGALEVEVTVEGEKDPAMLTIGGVDPSGKSFYATCNKLPGDVFLLPKGIFEAVKAKPGYFNAD